MKIVIPGKNPDLSAAELESLFAKINWLNNCTLSVGTEEINIDRLGGAVKIGQAIEKIEPTHSELASKLAMIIKHQVESRKFNFGLSYYGDKQMDLNRLGIQIKKELKKMNTNPRLVKSLSQNLNTAAVTHNQLTKRGVELLLIEQPNSLLVAKTESVQDIDSYSKRDYQKPCRDNQNGMLPPKLSQILINLSKANDSTTVVDPFCGSGSLLIEACLMGLPAEGSDHNPAMIECSQKNLDWFIENFKLNTKPNIVLNTADATKRDYLKKDYVIATEGWLGQNFSSPPSLTDILKQKAAAQKLYLDFFRQIAKQPLRPSYVVICAPFWPHGPKRIRLDIIDDIVKLGYTYSEFKSVRASSLEYYREGQYTGRQILVFGN